MIKKIINKLSENPFISDLVRSLLLFSISRKHIRNFISLDKNENILELGCGTGRFSAVFNSFYVGADIDIMHIKYAQKKHNSNTKRFIITDGKYPSFKDKIFDKSAFIQSLHHINNSDSLKIFRELSRITKREIYIVDWIPFKFNIFGKYLQLNDRGKYIRTFEEQKNLINEVFDIKKAYTSHSGQITSSFFICRAKEH